VHLVVTSNPPPVDCSSDAAEAQYAVIGHAVRAFSSVFDSPSLAVTRSSRHKHYYKTVDRVTKTAEQRVLESYHYLNGAQMEVHA
jgi:hypothetical protein